MTEEATVLESSGHMTATSLVGECLLFTVYYFCNLGEWPCESWNLSFSGVAIFVYLLSLQLLIEGEYFSSEFTLPSNSHNGIQLLEN